MHEHEAYMTKKTEDRSSVITEGGRGRIRRYYLWYSLLFILLMAGVFLAFLLTGHSMVWKVDGRSQYYPQMVYLRRYILELFSGLFHGGGTLKFYDFAIGMGEGIIVATRMHRLDVLSALVPLDLIGIFYTAVIVVRLYLGGISFSMYCRYRRMDDRAVLVGCILYLSSGFAMRWVPINPFFGAALYILPLMLLAVEKVLQEGNGLWMIAASALSFMVVYYFAYMCTIVVAFYYLLRWPQVCRRENVVRGGNVHGFPGRNSNVSRGGNASVFPGRNVNASRGGSAALFFKKGFLIIGTWLIGACMMAWVLVPTFTHLFDSDRVKIEQAGNLLGLYPLKYYGNLLLGLISPNVDAGFNTRLNFVALAIPVLVILFFGKIRGLKSLKLAMILQTVGLCVPMAGFVMGAFGNVNNRWTFVVAFSLALACVRVLEAGPVYNRTSLMMIGGLSAVYLAGTVAVVLFGERLHISSGYRNNIAAGCVCLVVTSAAFLIMNRRKVTYRIHILVIGTIAFLSAVLMGLVTFLPGFGGCVEEFMTWNDLPSFYEDHPSAVLTGLTKNSSSFCRADTGYASKAWLGNSLYHDYYGVAEFNSVMNAGEQRYLLELENSGILNTVKIRSMEGRAVCENMASVRYYLTGEKDNIIPYGFERSDIDAGPADVLYENQMPLSFAYTYDSVISSGEYENLSAAAKQQVFMKSAVLDEEDIDDQTAALSTEVPQTEEIIVPVSPGETSVVENVSVDGGGYVFNKGGGLSIPYMKRAGCECYLRLCGIDYEDANEADDDESLTVACSGGKRRIFLNGINNVYYVPLKNRMIYTGYSSSDEADEMKVRFFGKGRLTVDSIEFCYIPMASYETDVSERNEGGCSSPKCTVNQIEGDLEDAGERFVVLSALYSDGWKIKVDGEAVQPVRANRCYVGFYVPAGAHHFVLTYTPRYLTVAIVVTLAAWICCCMVFVLKRVAGKEKDEEN